MSLIAWFSQLFASRKQPPMEPVLQLTRQAAVVEPFDLLASLGTEYEPEARHPPAFDAPEFQPLVDAVREAIAKKTVELPSFPPLAAQIFGTIEHPDFELSHLVNLVRRDPALAAEVLGVANSMLFAASEPLENIRDAVVRLGARETAQAVSAVSARALFDLEARGSQDLFGGLWHFLWHHAMVCGFTASWMSMTLRKGDLDRLFLAGMLHDIGKTVGLRALSSLFLSGTAKPPPPVVHAVLEEVHVELALQVARNWHLTDGVLVILHDHHGPTPGDENALVVQLVSALKEIKSNPFHREGLEDEVRSAVAGLALTEQQQRALLTQLREMSQRVTSLV